MASGGFTRRTVFFPWRRKPDVVKLGREDATALFRIFQEALTKHRTPLGRSQYQLALEQTATAWSSK